MTIKTVHLSNLDIPPGELLQEETKFREMSKDTLADGVGLPIQAVQEIFCGERPITPKTAAALESLLGIDAIIWLNLEASYRLTLANNYEVYGHANPFDGPESEWPDLDLEPLEQADTEAAASPGD